MIYIYARRVQDHQRIVSMGTSKLVSFIRSSAANITGRRYIKDTKEEKVGDIRLCEWEKTAEREGGMENRGKGVRVREHVSGELERKGERDAGRGIR
jgi:hypothetical protein